MAYLTPDGPRAVESESTSGGRAAGALGGGPRHAGRRVRAGAHGAPRRGGVVHGPLARRPADAETGSRRTRRDDLDTRVLLDVPVDPADVPAVAWDAQWETGSTVLVTWAVTHGPAGEVSRGRRSSRPGAPRPPATAGSCRATSGYRSAPWPTRAADQQAGERGPPTARPSGCQARPDVAGGAARAG